MKTCSKCKQVLPLADFYKQRGSKDGVKSTCKRCSSLFSSQYKYRYPDRYAQQQEHNKTDPAFRSMKKKAKDKSRQKKRELNQCTDCGRPQKAGTLCILHWIGNIVRTMIHYRMKQRVSTIEKCRRDAVINQLHQKLLNTPYCPFTNEPLIPGKNVQLDHILPRSRFPELALDPDNLQWVSKTYNNAKDNKTDEEFARHWRLTYIP